MARVDITQVPQQTPHDVQAWGRPIDKLPDPNVSRQLAIPPWYVTPIPTAVNFFTYARPFIVVPAGAGSTVVTVPTSGAAGTGGAFQVPVSMVALLSAVAIFADAPTTNTDLTYIFRQNGAPIAGLDQIGFASRNAANLEIDIGGTNFLNDGCYIDVLIRNNNAFGPWNVSATITGWFASPDDIYRFTGMRPGLI